MTKVEKPENGTAENPWRLKTPPQTSEFTMRKAKSGDGDVLVCTAGKTVLHYDYRCLADLHEMPIHSNRDRRCHK